jgi:hypothetical protein
MKGSWDDTYKVGEEDELFASRHHRNHENRDMKQVLIRRRVWNLCVVHGQEDHDFGRPCCGSRCHWLSRCMLYYSIPLSGTHLPIWPDAVLSSISMQRKNDAHGLDYSLSLHRTLAAMPVVRILLGHSVERVIRVHEWAGHVRPHRHWMRWQA